MKRSHLRRLATGQKKLRPRTELAKEYAPNNPLGSVVAAFEAMADCIRAGESYDAVLADYGLCRVVKDK